MKKVLGFVVTLAVIGYAVFTEFRSDQVVDYNDRVVDLLGESQMPFEPFWEVLQPWFEGGQIVHADLAGTIDTIQSEHDRVLTELSTIEVPGSEECQSFHAAVMRYIEMDAEIIAAYRQVSDFVAAHNPTSLEADYDQVSLLVDGLHNAQEVVFQEVLDLQGALAEAHDLELR